MHLEIYAYGAYKAALIDEWMEAIAFEGTNRGVSVK